MFTLCQLKRISCYRGGNDVIECVTWTLTRLLFTRDISSTLICVDNVDVSPNIDILAEGIESKHA